MTEYITVVGNIASEPERRALPSGEPIAKFRLAATTQRRKEDGSWVDGHTSWYTVSAFRRLGEHAITSLAKGQRVIVTGRFRVRSWDSPTGTRGTEAEIDADALGHDLLFGTTKFTRADHKSVASVAPPPAADPEPQVSEQAAEGAPELVGAVTWDPRPLGDPTPF